MHWFNNYLDHHKRALDVTQLPGDPCLMYRRSNQDLQIIVPLQVEDTLYAATESFSRKEDAKAQEFPSKSTTVIGKKKIRFNGVDISRVNCGIQIEQAIYFAEFNKEAPKKDMRFKEFRSIRAKYAYEAYSTTPNVLIYVAILALFMGTRYQESSEEALWLL